MSRFRTTRIVVRNMEPGLKNASGGRDITFTGVTPNDEVALCVLVFETGEALRELKDCLDSN